MKKTNINYPHPVLSASNEDYLDCSFDVMLTSDPVIEGNIASFEVCYDLICPSLEELIASQKARVVIYLESVVAEFRKIYNFDSDSKEINININKDSINQEVEVRGYIIAAETLSPFRLPEHNKELLGDVPFTIRHGDILAVSEHFHNVPILDYDPLADRPSIFSVRQQFDRPNEEVSVDFLSDHKIKILLNSETYEKYQKLYEAPELRMVLASFLAAPVLADVLSFLKNANDEDLDSVCDKKWYSVVQTRLSTLKIDLKKEDSMTKVANQVLPHIFKSSLDSLKQVFDALIPHGGESNEG